MITIVTPVYNSGRYLRPCLDSILAQTYGDWQLVLIDDGSTDGSAEICDEYGADPRVEVLHVPNGGASRARNLGMDAARGEWVAFIDSDDVVSPSYLADMLAATTADCDMVLSGWTKDGVVTQLTPLTTDTAGFLNLFDGGDHYINYCYTWCKLCRTSVLNDNGLRFDPGVCWAEDSLFFCRMALFCRRITLIDAVNYTYVTHSDSSINRLNSFEAELTGFEAAKELVPRVLAVAPQVRLSPYTFLSRAITSLYRSPLSRSERLSRLRRIEFDPKTMTTREKGLRQQLYYRLVRGRHWRLLDYILTR